MNESSYRTLVAWQEAMNLAVEVYAFSKVFPDDERFQLVRQMRRCVVSIPSNIAEGSGRGNRDYRHFLYQARGSVFEIETQVALSERLRYCTLEDADRIHAAIAKAARPLEGLIASLDREIGAK